MDAGASRTAAQLADIDVGGSGLLETVMLDYDTGLYIMLGLTDYAGQTHMTGLNFGLARYGMCGVFSNLLDMLCETDFLFAYAVERQEEACDACPCIDLRHLR